MFIEYDENELTQLFKSEPIFIYEKEAGMFIYSYIDKFNTKITINVSIYENEVILLLSKNEEIMFEKKFDNVQKIIAENNCLKIYQVDFSEVITIQLMPNVYMDNK